MGLSTLQLEAFAEVARSGSFSRAAKNLFVTQSALSQRIQNLESELATALFVRDPSGLRLTPAGDELLRFCHVRESLESELLATLATGRESLGGVVRVGAFSSVMRSMVLPALSALIIEHPDINIELFTRELRELPKMLSNNEVDIIVTSNALQRQDIESVSLGYEENVLVESTKLARNRSEIYLDHDPEDPTTIQFFKLNGLGKKKLVRNYLDEVYAIIDGVKRGLGRAVLPRHLVRGENGLRIVSDFKPLKVPVMIQYFRQPYYSKLQMLVIETLRRNAAMDS